MLKVALIIGHNAKFQGAKSYNGTYEWSWNVDLLRYLLPKFKSGVCDIKPMWRSSLLAYTDGTDELIDLSIRPFEPDLVIELHLNAFDGVTEIPRAECIIGDQKNAETFADIWRENMRKTFSTDPKKIKSKDHSRGRYGIKNISLTGVPVLILEPCFADTRNALSEKVIEDPASYAEVLEKSIRRFMWLKVSGAVGRDNL